MAGQKHRYLGGSPGFSVKESTDLDHYRAQPGRWTVEVTQLAKGSFGSRIRSMELPGLIAYHNQWDCPALIHGQSPEGWLMFGGVIRPDKASVNWCGRQITDRRCFAATGDDREIQFTIDYQAQNVVVLIEPGLLGATVGEKAVEELRATKHLDFGDSGPFLLHAVLDLLARCEQQPHLLEKPAIALRAASVLLRHVEDCFARLDLTKMEEGASSRGDIVHQALLHVRQAREATSAWGMAQAVGVSQKTLELAFREVMDITPGQYLVLTRLNRAHHALAYADETSTTVTDLALGLGFTHMGRFAKAYKDLFGELPSQTLKKSGA